MNLDELIVSTEKLIISEVFGFGRKKEPYVPGSNLPPEERARRSAKEEARQREILQKQESFKKHKQQEKDSTQRLRSTSTPTDIPVVGSPPEAPATDTVASKPRHADNGGVGPRFGDYLEHSGGLWKIIGNDSPNMTSIVQDPKSGKKAKLGWDKMVKDRDHKGKAIFVKG